MTSSLVGSEMCIRDRKRSSRDPGDPQGESTWTTHRPEEPERGKGSEEAVSYTHLTLPTICSV
eukprot:4953095-Prorocentrum_lima.AAC.1